MKKSPKPTIWLAMTAVMAIVGAGGMYIEYGSLSEKTRDYSTLKSLVRRPYQVEDDLAKTEEEVRSAQESLNHLEKAVPAFAYVPTLLKELEDFGKQHGLKVFGVRPMPKKESPKDKKNAGKPKIEPYVELVIEVKGRGSYSSISSFVRDLQTFPKIVAARAISLSPQNTPGQVSNLLDMTVELKTFLFRPSQLELEALSEELKKNGVETVPGSDQPHQTAQPATGGNAPIQNPPSAPAQGVNK